MNLKSIISGLGLSSLILFASCSNEANNQEVITEGETGGVTLHFDFEGEMTKAASTAKPTTSWADVKNVDIFFTQSGVIKAVKNIAVSQLQGSTSKTYSIKDVKVGTYDVYAFANSSDAAMVPEPAKNGSQPLWSAGAVVGKNIDAVYMALKAASPATEVVEGTTQNIRNKAVDLFAAKVSGVAVTVGASKAVSLALSRNMALLRIRINRNGYQTSMATDAFVKLHNMPEKISANGSLDSYTANTVIKVVQNFETSDPTPGARYSSGTILSAPYTEYIDILVPESKSKRPFVVLKGKNGSAAKFYSFYIPSGMSIKKNTILECNVTLTNEGDPTEPPTPSQVGNVDLTVTVVDWGTIESGDVEA